MFNSALMAALSSELSLVQGLSALNGEEMGWGGGDGMGRKRWDGEEEMGWGGEEQIMQIAMNI